MTFLCFLVPVLFIAGLVVVFDPKAAWALWIDIALPRGRIFRWLELRAFGIATSDDEDQCDTCGMQFRVTALQPVDGNRMLCGFCFSNEPPVMWADQSGNGNHLSAPTEDVDIPVTVEEPHRDTWPSPAPTLNESLPPMDFEELPDLTDSAKKVVPFAEQAKQALAAINRIGTGRIERTKLVTEGPRSYSVVVSCAACFVRDREKGSDLCRICAADLADSAVEVVSAARSLSERPGGGA
jgi:hypothetical protein